MAWVTKIMGRWTKPHNNNNQPDPEPGNLSSGSVEPNTNSSNAGSTQADNGNQTPEDLPYGPDPFTEKVTPDDPSEVWTWPHIPEGYAQAAALINSDEDSAVFRCFGEVRARILLHKQAELCDLEARLRALDKRQRNDGNNLPKILGRWEPQLEQLKQDLDKTEEDLLDVVKAIEKAEQELKDLKDGQRVDTSEIQIKENVITDLHAKKATLESEKTRLYKAIQKKETDIKDKRMDHDELKKVVYLKGEDMSKRNAERIELLKEFESKLTSYDDQLLRYKEVIALPKASRWQIRLFWRFMNAYKPFLKSDGHILDEPEDVITLRKESLDIFHLRPSIVELFVGKSRAGLKPFEKTPKDPAFDKYSRQRMIRFGRIVFGLAITALIVSGVIALYFINDKDARLGTLIAFTVLCALLLSGLTQAKLGEIVAGTAAYCAVLVVFVGQALNNDNTAGNMGNAAANITARAVD